MKKLLLVLMVVAMASFLFVGCLPGLTPEPEPEPEPEVPTVTIVVEDEYTGSTYIRADNLDVTVTFSEAVEAEYIVSLKADGAGTDVTKTLTPNADRTIWTYEDFPFSGVALEDCEDICLIVEVKHPCCPGEEVYYKIVTVDSEAPYADLYLTFTDCNVDECNPDPSAKFSFSSNTEGLCGPEACCGDDCSGFASWSVEVIPATACDPACDLIEGDICPVEGETKCACLDYATEGTLTYEVNYTLTDNVGNKFEDTWTITVDTDSVVSVTVPKGTNITTVVFDTEYGIYTDNCAEEE